MYNNYYNFLNVASQVEEDSKSQKFYMDNFKYYEPTDLNVKCLQYTFFQRYFIFRKAEPNLDEIRKLKQQSKRDSVQSKKGYFVNKDIY